MQGVIQILVKQELILWQVCLGDKDGVSSNVYLQDINMIKNDQDAKSDPNIGQVGIEPMESMS